MDCGKQWGSVSLIDSATKRIYEQTNPKISPMDIAQPFGDDCLPIFRIRGWAPKGGEGLLGGPGDPIIWTLTAFPFLVISGILDLAWIVLILKRRARDPNWYPITLWLIVIVTWWGVFSLAVPGNTRVMQSHTPSRLNRRPLVKSKGTRRQAIGNCGNRPTPDTVDDAKRASATGSECIRQFGQDFQIWSQEFEQWFSVEVAPALEE